MTPCGDALACPASTILTASAPSVSAAAACLRATPSVELDGPTSGVGARPFSIALMEASSGLTHRPAWLGDLTSAAPSSLHAGTISKLASKLANAHTKLLLAVGYIQ